MSDSSGYLRTQVKELEYKLECVRERLADRKRELQEAEDREQDNE